MDLEKKIWAAFAVLFLTVVHGFLRLNIGLPPDAGAIDFPGMVAFFIFTPPLLILQKNNPHVHVTLFLLMSIASYFCVLMMVRPLVTDFGLLHGLFYMAVFLANEEFGTQWPYWLASGLSALMIILRVVMEMRARRD
ncbi:hypothetical protein H5410_016492 [Solanum commersonii]|uniref:Uncharacterized protein n=1 Tax=Solanum commersonii TaxID=4109 RepID=A0A9J5ZXI9_SOLCO|nr:hypothetical protein H5410_016492 [Solanum commersonii]